MNKAVKESEAGVEDCQFTEWLCRWFENSLEAFIHRKAAWLWRALKSGNDRTKSPWLEIK